MKIISYINRENKYSRNLKKSLEKFRYEYFFIGIGDIWNGFVRSKINTVYTLLLKSPDDIYCIIDGYDMLACRSGEDMEREFGKFSSPIVFGGEKMSFSYNSVPVKKYSSFSPLKYRKFLNGGFCIGYRKNLIDMYEWVISESKKKGINDDQKLFCTYSNLFQDRVSIDISQKLVLNTITTIDNNNFKKIGNRLVIKTFESEPYFIHFPSISSDGYSRYNNFGNEILGKVFWKGYGEKSFNFFANLKLYFFIFIFILFISYKVFGKFSVLFFPILFLIVCSKVSL